MDNKFSFLYFAWATVLVALFIVFWQFTFVHDAPTSFMELERFSAIVPYAAQGKYVEALNQSIQNNYNCIYQFIVYQGIKSTLINEPNQCRFIEYFFIILSLIWIFRLTRFCSNGLIASITTLLLAIAPISLWSSYSIVIFCALLNIERFFIAIVKQSLSTWVCWTLATTLLLYNWIYAEPIMLQNWLLALLCGLGVFLVLQRFLFEDKDFFFEPVLKIVQIHAFASAFLIILLISCSLSCLAFFMIGDCQFTFFNFIVIITTSLILSLLLAYSSLSIPILRHLFNELKVDLWSINITDIIEYKAQLNLKLNRYSFFKTLFYFAVAIFILLPIFYWSQSSVDIFISSFDGDKFKLFFHKIPAFKGWALLLLPFCMPLWAILGAYYKLLSPSRLFYSLVIIFLASLYLFQQRYAPYAAPFYLIASVAAIIMPFELIWLKMRKING